MGATFTVILWGRGGMGIGFTGMGTFLSPCRPLLQILQKNKYIRFNSNVCQQDCLIQIEHLPHSRFDVVRWRVKNYPKCIGTDMKLTFHRVSEDYPSPGENPFIISSPHSNTHVGFTSVTILAATNQCKHNIIDQISSSGLAKSLRYIMYSQILLTQQNNTSTFITALNIMTTKPRSVFHCLSAIYHEANVQQHRL